MDSKIPKIIFLIKIHQWIMASNLTFTHCPLPSNKDGLIFWVRNNDVWLVTFKAVEILRKDWQVHEILMERKVKEMFCLCLEDSKDISVMLK